MIPVELLKEIMIKRFGVKETACRIARHSENLARFGHAAHRFASSGFTTTPPEALATREATCKACPEWDAQALNKTGRCRKCGCSTWAKLRMATERCPLGKWEPHLTTPPK